MEEAIGMRARFSLFQTNPIRAWDVPVDRGQHLIKQSFHDGDL
jgi:hypothetical protein